jgi:hypothetical protein
MMAIQNINVGNSANDGTGDDLREAFIKINQNFQELDLVAFQSAENLGSSGARVYASTVDNVLKFRRLVAGPNVTLQELDNTIVIDTDSPIGNFVITGDSGSLIAGPGLNYNMYGASGIVVGVNENTKTITINGALVNELTPMLGGNLNGNNKQITNVNYIATLSIVTPSVVATKVTLTDIQSSETGSETVDYYSSLGRYIEGFNFGEFSSTTNNSILDWVINQVGVDFGSFVSPTPGTVDLGTVV